MNDTMRKFVRGLMVGMVSMGTLPESKEKVPIAYLYNGVQLPPLPEWDRESYPYAYISREVEWVSGTTYRVLYLFSSPFPVDENGNVLYTGTRASAICYSWEDAWGEVMEMSGSGTGFAPVWSNYDIYDANGTLYLAASEPIPVYE